MANPEQPPYIQEMQQPMMNLQQSVEELEKQTTDLTHNIQDVDILTQHVHETLFTQQKREAAKQTAAKGWPKEFTSAEREMRSSVGILRKLELPISSPPHMDATCMEGTNLPLSPSYAGKASGQNTPLRITSTSDTTNAIRSQFGTRAITQYTLATNHIELASCHKPATWKETSTWRSRPPCTLWPRTLTAT